MVSIRKRFIDLMPVLNDNLKGIDVTFDEETAFYTAKAAVGIFKRYFNRSVVGSSFHHYIQRRVIRQLDLVMINSPEPEVVDGQIVAKFQLCG